MLLVIFIFIALLAEIDKGGRKFKKKKDNDWDWD
jgi:hypothetical protein